MIIFTLVILIVTFIISSYKAGFLLFFSPKSGLAKWEIRKEKISLFIVVELAAIMLLYVVFQYFFKLNEGWNVFLLINSVESTILLLHMILLVTPVKTYKREKRKYNGDNGEWPSGF
jgi:hypothetical protein